MFWAGAPAPPLRTEPSSRSVTPDGATEPFSSCVIWPIFSSMVICARSAAARAVAGRLGSCQSRLAAGPGVPDGLALDGGRGDDDVSLEPQALTARRSTRAKPIRAHPGAPSLTVITTRWYRPRPRQSGQPATDVGGGKLIASVTDADGNVIALVQAS